MSKIYARPLVVATLAITLAVGTAGCQTIADLDPTGLIGGDNDSRTPDSQFPPDSRTSATQPIQRRTTPDLASPARASCPAATATAQANTSPTSQCRMAPKHNTAQTLCAPAQMPRRPPAGCDRRHSCRAAPWPVPIMPSHRWSRCAAHSGSGAG